MRRSPKFITQPASADAISGTPEAVHVVQEPPVELEAELLAAVAEQRDEHDQRAAEVADDDPERALLVDDDEDHRERDGDADVQERRDREGDRPLLGAEEVRHLGVVDVHPEQDGGGDDEARAAALESRAGAVVHAEQLRDLRGEDDAEGQRERRVPHLRPEDGADEPSAVLGLLVEEVPADEAEVGAAADQDHRHGHHGHEELDPAVVPDRDVARVERQHQDREEARDQAADAVDRRVPAELEEPRAEGPRPSAGLRLRFLCHGPRWYVEWWPCRAPFRFLSGTSGVPAGCSTCWELRAVRLGDDVPYRPEAWEAVERGELPDGDDLAAGLLPPRAGRGARERRSTGTDASSPPPRVSIRSTRRSSGCAGSSGPSRRATAERGSPSRSRTTSTSPGAGRGSACAARPRG